MAEPVIVPGGVKSKPPFEMGVDNFDVLIQYATQTIGLSIQFPFIIATLVAVWIVTNEIISILENIIDINEKILPPFLMPLVRRIKKEIETIANEDNKAEQKGNQ